MAEMEVTPPLDDFIRDYEADGNLWWRTDCGHHQNLFEAAVERMKAAEVQVDREATARLAKALLFALRSHGEATLDNGARVRVLPEAVLRDVLEFNGVEVPS
jgi:hypothetical protein